MRKYSDEEERGVRTDRLVREWGQSGLIDRAQRARMLLDVRLDLRRTNLFLRVTLLGFGLLIVAASVGLVMVTANIRSEGGAAAICFGAAVAFAGAAEFLAGRFRLYRFGFEEACAVGAAALASAAGALLVEPHFGGSHGERQLLAAPIAGAVAAFAVYRRYGYLYAVAASMACAGLAPFTLGVSPVAERLLAAALLSGCFVAAHLKHRQQGVEYPGDEYRVLAAAAVLGVYGALNLQLSLIPTTMYDTMFYRFTYVVIWILPVSAFIVATRRRDRLLLDASLVMALATLVTNKPYLGLDRKPWDPVLLGVLPIGGALAIRRWLTAGNERIRGGFTAARILREDQDAVALVGIASGFRDAPAGAPTQQAPPDQFAGGRSGGGGTTGSF